MAQRVRAKKKGYRPSRDCIFPNRFYRFAYPDTFLQKGTRFGSFHAVNSPYLNLISKCKFSCTYIIPIHKRAKARDLSRRELMYREKYNFFESNKVLERSFVSRRFFYPLSEIYYSTRLIFQKTFRYSIRFYPYSKFILTTVMNLINSKQSWNLNKCIIHLAPREFNRCTLHVHFEKVFCISNSNFLTSRLHPKPTKQKIQYHVVWHKIFPRPESIHQNPLHSQGSLILRLPWKMKISGRSNTSR